jgi:hypothetical protein
MVNPKSGTVVTIPRPKVLTPASGNTEQPKAFQFSVTWDTLLAVPQPAEITEILPVVAVVAAPVVVAPVVVAGPLEVVPREAPAHALQVVQPPPRRPQGDEAAWEMVVPKMVRRQS